jgi:hypothetical protein
MSILGRDSLNEICRWFSYFFCAARIATRYGLDGPGIGFRWGRDFSYPSRPPSLLYSGYLVFFSGLKAAGEWP